MLFRSFAMFNLIGSVPEVASLLKAPGAHLHLYGKQPREGRKLGHVNVRLEGAPQEGLQWEAMRRLVGAGFPTS